MAATLEKTRGRLAELAAAIRAGALPGDRETCEALGNLVERLGAHLELEPDVAAEVLRLLDGLHGV